MSPSEKYSSALSLKFANGSTPTIAVRYWAGRLVADISREALGAGMLASVPAGCQVQTWIDSSMFLNRCGPASTSATLRRLPASWQALPETAMPPGAATDSRRTAMLTSSPNTSSSSAITSPMWMPIRNCIRRSAGKVFVSFRHHLLHRNGRFDGADDAGKFQQEAVPGVLHQAAAVIEDDRIDRGPVRLERGVRTRLVGPHHAGVAGDVSADDGCQASFHIPIYPQRCPGERIPLRGRPTDSNVYKIGGIWRKADLEA